MSSSARINAKLLHISFTVTYYHYFLRVFESIICYITVIYFKHYYEIYKNVILWKIYWW